MQTQRYPHWSLRLHQRIVAQRVPAKGTIEVTQRCNQACVHCYNNRPISDLEARKQELTCEEHRRIIDEITEAGCLWLLYTGGEIFVRKDFLDIYTYAKRKGLIISLFTNGTLITHEIADCLEKWRPFSIEITLYGRTRETYERVTRVPGSYERCMRGIRLLVERGLPLKLKSMALTLNREEIWDIKKFAEAELGLKFRFDALINARLNGSRTPFKVRLQPEEVVALDVKDPKRKEALTEFCERTHGSPEASHRCDELFHCGAGVTAFSIDPQGISRICGLCQDPGYDLRQGSFQEAWQQTLLKTREKKTTRQTKCSRCTLKAMCGMCPAYGALENGDAEKPVDFLCQVAHLRAYSMGIPVPCHGDCAYCQGGSRYSHIMDRAERLRRGDAEASRPPREPSCAMDLAAGFDS